MMTSSAEPPVVLTVDDESVVREMLRRWLARAGYAVAEAEDADAALQRMREVAVSVVLCDVQMPGRDGLWLTGELRRQYPAVPVVLATVVSTVLPSISLHAGVLAYLIKPITERALLDAVKQALAWRQELLVSGPRPEDTGEALTAWLESLEL